MRRARSCAAALARASSAFRASSSCRICWSDSAEGGLGSGGAVCEAWARTAAGRSALASRTNAKTPADAERWRDWRAGSSGPDAGPCPSHCDTANPVTGCSIHEGLAVKRAFLFAVQPLLPWLGRSNPSARSA